MGWVVKATLRSLYPRERPGAHFTGGWRAPGPVWREAKNLAPTGIRSPTVQPVASRYTDYISWPPIKELLRIRKSKKNLVFCDMRLRQWQGGFRCL